MACTFDRGGHSWRESTLILDINMLRSHLSMKVSQVNFQQVQPLLDDWVSSLSFMFLRDKLYVIFPTFSDV